MFVYNGIYVEILDYVFKDGYILGKINLEEFIVYFVIIDLIDISNGVLIEVEDILKRIENRKIEERSIIFLKIGYDDRVWGKDYFWDKFLWLDVEVVKVVVNLKFRIVGIDF